MSEANTFPTAHFPTAFADGVSSIAHSPAVVKFYLFRFDPSFLGNNTYNTQQVAQVVMPMEGFASMCAFFEHSLAGYIAQGLITKERYAELAKAVVETGGGAAK